MRTNSITSPEFQQRFLSRMIRTASGCLEWQGGKIPDGYGCVKCDGKNELTHRVAWVLVNGPIPNGLDVLHKCDNPSCCDPEHLFLGTHLDNMHDRNQKGRSTALKGEHNGRAKLSAADVLYIRRVYVHGSHVFGICALGRRFHVSHTQISYIVRRESWRHV